MILKALGLIDKAVNDNNSSQDYGGTASQQYYTLGYQNRPLIPATFLQENGHPSVYDDVTFTVAEDWKWMTNLTDFSDGRAPGPDFSDTVSRYMDDEPNLAAFYNQVVDPQVPDRITPDITTSTQF
ncbi:hypothetical protein CLAIMM_15135 [Cladophialophora immunda]|nr:hypothetical protein CLAIMM_15135 [Cladophialophora immunda]